MQRTASRGPFSHSTCNNKEMQNPVFLEIFSEIHAFAHAAKSLESLQQFAVDLIAEHLPHYNWAGFYMLDASDPNTLVLGPFHGASTEHVRIPVTEGICGAAAAHGETVIIDDVSSDPRYLACSLETRSEIVVPIRVNGKIVGEIDVDSHELAAFSPDDRDFLESCAAIIARFMAMHPQ
jgi:L-methionine (R)-S-oxide reductase